MGSIRRFNRSDWLGAGLTQQRADDLVSYFQGWRRQLEQEVARGATISAPSVTRGHQQELGG